MQTLSDEMMTTPPRPGAAAAAAAAASSPMHADGAAGSGTPGAASACAPGSPPRPVGEPEPPSAQVDLWVGGRAFRLECCHAAGSSILAPALELPFEGPRRGGRQQLALPAMDPDVFRITAISLRCGARFPAGAWAHPADAAEYGRQLDCLGITLPPAAAPPAPARGDEVPARLRRRADDLDFALQVYDDLLLTRLSGRMSGPLGWLEEARAAFDRRLTYLGVGGGDAFAQRLQLMDLDWGARYHDVCLALSCVVEQDPQRQPCHLRVGYPPGALGLGGDLPLPSLRLLP